MAEVIVALDSPTAGEALAIVDRLGERADRYKVGLELYTRAGPDLVRELVGRGRRIFLDLKLHDIPNTVAGAVEAICSLGVELATVHASGGTDMLAVAQRAAAGRVRLLGVTVLTSLSAEDLGLVWGREVPSVGEEVERLARLGAGGLLDGVVCSVLEARRVREALGHDLLVVTPGIRPSGTDRADQKRVATPAEAVAAGADYVVVGRAVTAAEDPSAALERVLEEMAGARAPGNEP